MRSLLHTLCLILLLASPAAAQVIPINFGEEWTSLVGRLPVQTCGENSACLYLHNAEVIDHIDVNVTNPILGQTLLVVLIASPCGTPWCPGVQRLFSRVLFGHPTMGSISPPSIVGPFVLAAGTSIFWAIDCAVEPGDQRPCHFEHQSTVNLWAR